MRGADSWSRVYDHSTLKKLLYELKTKNVRYYAEREGSWLPVAKSVADKVKSGACVKAITLLELAKLNRNNAT